MGVGEGGVGYEFMGCGWTGDLMKTEREREPFFMEMFWIIYVFTLNFKLGVGFYGSKGA